MKPSEAAVRAAINYDVEDTKRWLRERGYTAQEARNLVKEHTRPDVLPDYLGMLQVAYDIDFPTER